MSVVALFGYLLLAAALPAVMPRTFGLAAHGPDLWVALVAYLALRGRGYAAVGWGIALGFLQDALSLDPLGTHAFVLGLTAFVFCEGQGHRKPVDGVTRLFAVLGAALLAGWLYVLRVLPFGGGALVASDLVHALPMAAFTALFAWGFFPILDHFRVFDDLIGRSRGLPA